MHGLVTVFGCSGFLGRHVVRALTRGGWRIRAAVRNPHLNEHLRVPGAVGQVQLVPANIRYPKSVERALDGAQACINMVGILRESGRQSFESVHVTGARTVAEAAAARGIERFVHVSALGADLNSASKYARSKAEGEAAVREHVPGATILRPSVIFGPEDGFFNKFAKMASQLPALPLVGGGETRFQPVYAGDVAQAIERAISHPAFAGLTYELGGPTAYSFRELMEFVLEQTRRERFLAPLPFFAARPLGQAFDIASKVLPIEPPITADQVELLKTDNVPSSGAPGLEAFGIAPASIEAIVPSYLWRYRKGGQFSEGGSPGLMGSTRQT